MARIYESKAFIALTGILMDADGLVTKTVSDSDFKDMATIIVQGMLDGNINTRSLNSINSPRYLQLMKELKGVLGADDGNQDAASNMKAAGSASKSGHGVDSADKPGTTSAVGGKTVGATGGTSQGGAASQGTGSTTTATRRGRKTKLFLDLEHIKVPDSYPTALKLLVEELSDLNVQIHPNVTFLTLRAVLEKSIKSFAEAKSVVIKGTGNNDKGRVQLGHALKWLLEHVQADGPPYLKQCIESVRTGKLMYTTTKDSFDAVNHNHHFKVDSDEAISMWGSIDPIMKYLMKP